VLDPLSARPLDDATTPSFASDSAPIRVTIVQPALAKYRIPVFRELARRPGIALRVVYSAVANLPNAAADDFVAVPSNRWEGRIGPALMFHGAEWTECSGRSTDVVVLRWSPRSLSLAPGLLRSRMNGVGSVLWGHGYSKSERRWWVNSRNWLARRADALVFYDPNTREKYVRDGWDPQRLFVAINCLDHSEIDAARRWWEDRPEELAEFRRQHGLDSGPTILFVSRLQPANRVDLLVLALAKLLPDIPTLKTVIIGSGNEEKRRLTRIAEDLVQAGSVVFLEGIYDERRLAAWFLSADVFCYPSNVGLSLIHALWYGLPVVTSDNLACQNPEVVALEHGVNGLLYEHGSVASLAGALRQIIMDQHLADSMSVAARAEVESRFTIPKMVDGLEAAIRFAHRSAVGRRAAQSS
jgi:glycosyltransferase involved in cell wall biosynthesis